MLWLGAVGSLLAEPSEAERKNFEETKAKAEKGDAIFQSSLGARYELGIGVSKDPAEAVKWYRKAAEQGEPLSQIKLGIIYRDGKGVPQDYAEARKWYRRAAEQGDARAQSLLGYVFFLGEGVAQDHVEAHKWMNLASAQGYDDWRKTLTSFERFMTREQIAQAQRLAREFKPRKAEAPGSAGSREATAEAPSSSGSGFFISDDGYFVTNEHVVKDGSKFRLMTSGGNYPGQNRKGGCGQRSCSSQSGGSLRATARGIEPHRSPWWHRGDRRISKRGHAGICTEAGQGRNRCLVRCGR